MKKALLIAIALSVAVTGILVGCANKKEEETSSSTKASANLEDYDTEVGIEKDENGEDVAVVYEVDKNGKTIAYVLDKDGNKKKNEKGEYVTVKTNHKMETTKKNNNASGSQNGESDTKKLTTTTTVPNTATTKKNIPLTQNKETTKFEGNETVPKTSDKGKQVNFSSTDQQAIKSMLEVPYLYLSNYENSDGVPIDIACYTAIWMAERDGGTSSVYPSSPVVLNLFKYFGQTVVNFKTQCNQAAKENNAPISYTSNDTFKITEYTSKKQIVKITGIEDLGDNNFYKITADVSNCDKKKVVAIVQKNKLDTSLGFSIKALKWS